MIKYYYSMCLLQTRGGLNDATRFLSLSWTFLLCIDVMIMYWTFVLKKNPGNICRYDICNSGRRDEAVSVSFTRMCVIYFFFSTKHFRSYKNVPTFQRRTMDEMQSIAAVFYSNFFLDSRQFVCEKMRGKKNSPTQRKMCTFANIASIILATYIFP